MTRSQAVRKVSPHHLLVRRTLINPLPQTGAGNCYNWAMVARRWELALCVDAPGIQETSAAACFHARHVAVRPAEATGTPAACLDQCKHCWTQRKAAQTTVERHKLLKDGSVVCVQRRPFALKCSLPATNYPTLVMIAYDTSGMARSGREHPQAGETKGGDQHAAAPVSRAARACVAGLGNGTAIPSQPQLMEGMRTPDTEAAAVHAPVGVAQHLLFIHPCNEFPAFRVCCSLPAGLVQWQRWWLGQIQSHGPSRISPRLLLSLAAGRTSGYVEGRWCKSALLNHNLHRLSGRSRVQPSFGRKRFDVCQIAAETEVPIGITAAKN